MKLVRKKFGGCAPDLFYKEHNEKKKMLPTYGGGNYKCNCSEKKADLKIFFSLNWKVFNYVI